MSEQAAGADSEITLQTVWPEGLTDQAQVVNQFAINWDGIRSDRSGMYLLIGHVGAPTWASEQIARERAQLLSNALPIQPRGAFYLTHERALELWKMLGIQLGMPAGD